MKSSRSGARVSILLAVALAPPFLLATTLPASAAQHEELQPDKEYSGETRVGSTELGISFVIPADWGGGVPPGAEVILLGSNVHPGMVIVTADGAMTVEKAKAMLAEPLVLDAATTLQPAGAPQVDGSRFGQRFTGQANGKPVVGRAVGMVTAKGTGILFVALGPEPEKAKLSALADQLLASVEEVAAPAPGATPSGGIAAQLRGKKLYYLKTSGSFSDKASTYLCSDGTALWSSHSTAMSTGGGGTLSYAGNAEARGRWSVSGYALTLQWESGEVERFQLSDGGGYLRVDASNYWLQDQDVCP